MPRKKKRHPGKRKIDGHTWTPMTNWERNKTGASNEVKSVRKLGRSRRVVKVGNDYWTYTR